jgi:hypothetical protein
MNKFVLALASIALGATAYTATEACAGNNLKDSMQGNTTVDANKVRAQAQASAKAQVKQAAKESVQGTPLSKKIEDKLEEKVNEEAQVAVEKRIQEKTTK